MIPVAEIRALQAEWQLRDDVIEKDYALGWVLAGIAAEPNLKDTWIFKGGTALRKCYFETYRLSEDLDFSLTSDGPDDPDQLVPIFQRVSAWLRSLRARGHGRRRQLQAPQEPACTTEPSARRSATSKATSCLIMSSLCPRLRARITASTSASSHPTARAPSGMLGGKMPSSCCA